MSLPSPPPTPANDDTTTGYRGFRGVLPWGRFWTWGLLATFVWINLNAVRLNESGHRALFRSSHGIDPVTASDAAFERARPLLPAAGTIGYLVEDFDRNTLDDLRGLFQAQYSLAPLILIPGPGPAFLVAVARADGILPPVPDGYEQAFRLNTRVGVYRRVP